MDTTSIAHLIYEAAVVKRTLRTGWQRLGDNSEGVGEHSFMTAVIAYFLARKIQSQKDQNRKADLEKVLIMSIFHDFHEGRTGETDKLAKFYLDRHEDRANEDIFGAIDRPLLETLNEYEKKQSLEARLVYEANIIAFGVECKILIEKGNQNASEWLSSNSERLRLPESVELMKLLTEMNSHDWWKGIRQEILEDFRK
jgi:5'-deoxynucleotidase YfbR-like HD superfamily hydrolase